MTSFTRDVLQSIRDVVGSGPVALHEPEIGSSEENAVVEALRSGYVSSVGLFVRRFEEELENVTGSPHAVAVSSGTSALHLALVTVGVNPGTEVFVPGFTFVATASAVVQAGAVPHFVDIDEETFGIDPVRLRQRIYDTCDFSEGALINKSTGNRVSAIVPMHSFGHIGHILEIVELAEEFGLLVVEDAAEALGSWFHGSHAGTFASVGCLSFNGNKIVTTGGGGALLFDDTRLAKRARHLSATAKIDHPWRFSHDAVGFNFRMPNINAALGLAQLRKLPDLISRKRAVFERYLSVFEGLRGAKLFREPSGRESNYWLQTLVLDESHALHRDEILATAHEQKIFLRPAWDIIPFQAPYEQFPSDSMVVAESLQRRVINLPSSAHIVKN